ncbi:hypothetical protein FE634_02235 [Nocardioides dongxiaopingii]|uniref:protein-arginine deiminase family protein n=1 Tax=Nocardioides sp. S-1144 TaxID=2582905 RepID=UPI00110ED98F|nr:protein-arginine deiminase family protein [Nocardioides sp. S-1144]QCW49523.1 hypothetical protein FE634_02235 [Nocardioides sp. S-1144]
MSTRSRSRRCSGALLATAVLGAGLAVTAVGPSSATAVSDTPLVLADTNRDGAITTADAAGRGTWTKQRGALFLANLDDDQQTCPVIGADGTTQLTDVQLASCNDAADDVVNGDSDALDLARVRVLPVGAGAVDSVRVELRGVGAAKVNVFVRRGAGDAADDWTPLPAHGILPADLLGTGVELGVEGTDIIRDESWDGTVTVRVVHRAGARQVATDQVELRVAPLLFVTDRMPIEKLYMADNATSVYEGATMPEPTAGTIRSQRNGDALAADFLAGMDRIQDDVELVKLPSMQGARGGGNGTDIWTQDIMEPGLMSIPSASGEQQMRVFVRAPVRDGRDNAGSNPFRQTGRVVFTELRGPDVAGVQHFDPSYVPATIPGMSYDSRGSTGNYGTVPAYEHDGESFPLGRKVLGAVPGTGFTADPAFNEMLDRQGFQDPIVVDTSWLSVGHIDEFMSVVPADNDRGWTVVAADPRLALDLLTELDDAGRGGETLYTPYDAAPVEGNTPPTMTVAEAVASPAIASGTAIGHAGVNRALSVLKRETGLTEDDIVRVPVLYTDARGLGRVGVQIPNAANLIGTGHDVVFIPTQHTPAVDGEDLFQAEIEKRLAEVGTDVQWAEDYFYTSRSGQIHCVTNALRDTTYGAAWWTEGASATPGTGTPTVPAPLATFSHVVRPTVQGRFRVGRTVRIDVGLYNATPETVSYRWYAGTKVIGTKAAQKLKRKWVGKRIRVKVTVTKRGYAPYTSVTTVGKRPLRK